MELVKIAKRKWFIRLDRKVKKDLKEVLKPKVKETSKSCQKMNDSMCLSETSYHLEDKLIKNRDVPTFAKLVKKHMENKKMTSKDIYNNSLIDRKLFSSLNVNDNYVPSKETAIMYCFALKLTDIEAKELLHSAGYALYEYSNFDIIVEYFLKNKIFNIDKLNDALYLYTKRCIGYR